MKYGYTTLIQHLTEQEDYEAAAYVKALYAANEQYYTIAKDACALAKEMESREIILQQAMVEIAKLKEKRI